MLIAVLTADGKLTVSSTTADIGTATYTIMTQIAADTLGLPIEDVMFTLSDSSLSNAPVVGGSFTASLVGSEVKVDQDLGTIHVTRVVSAVASGRQRPLPRDRQTRTRLADHARHVAGRTKAKSNWRRK